MAYNHKRQILCSADGHPVRWNDKLIVKTDKLATELYGNSILADLQLELYDRTANNKLMKFNHTGA